MKRSGGLVRPNGDMLSSKPEKETSVSSIGPGSTSGTTTVSSASSGVSRKPLGDLIVTRLKYLIRQLLPTVGGTTLSTGPVSVVFHAPVYVDLIADRTTDLNAICAKRKLSKPATPSSKRVKPTLIGERIFEESRVVSGESDTDEWTANQAQNPDEVVVINDDR